jgi:hypothetical protein
MSLFLKQEDSRSELQKRIATELQAKMAEKPEISDLPDGVDDSQYIKGTKQTTSLAWAWILIVVAAVSISIWLMVLSLSRN